MTDYETEPFPPLRASSPSPSIPATPAISSCTSPDRTFSTVSSHSAYSASSATSADGKSSTSVSSRRRGYIRPQGAEFADSARHRESVMSLGSIAHLQYYFARTGLLDGKGAQAREFRKKNKHEDVPKLLLTPNARYIPEDMAESPTATDDEILDQQQDEGSNEFDENEDVMLPPTVSTYSIKTYHIPPPPDLPAMRRDLLEAVERAEREIETIGSQTEPPADLKPPRISLSPDGGPETEEDILRDITPFSRPQAWHELQGMRILDVVTLAIRAARIYYTAHERPERLATVKSEREIRQALFHVLELLKRWASRNFSGGLREDERTAIMTWMSDVRTMLAKERELEDSEAKERSSWTWAHGDWTGRERERENAFLHSLIGSGPALPPLTSTDEGNALPTPLLERLSDGRDLVRMHNWAVKKSKRPFCEIKSFHEDIGKPYRRAENIRFWVKAAEIRWETKLELDVMAVVSGNNDDAWRQFDAALLQWCRAVREELTRDWWSAPATAYAN